MGAAAAEGSLEGEGILSGLHAFYASHREGGLGLVSRLQGASGRVYEAVYPRVSGVVVIETCNRFEVYVDGDPGGAAEGLREALSGKAGLLRRAAGLAAARRLARIAAGLESAIVGEQEVLGQVRRAWLEARERGYTTPLLDEVFHAALLAGKRAREETGIGRGNVGYPTAAVELASRLSGGLDGGRVLVVGTGDAAEAMVAYLCSKYRPASVHVAGRRLDAAARLASSCPGSAAFRLDPASLPGGYDVALVAVSGAPDLSWLSGISRVVVDISLPPAVPGAHGMGEVEELVREAVGERLRHVPAAEAIVEEELGKLLAKLRWRALSPALSALNSYADLLAREAAERISASTGASVERVWPELRSLYRRLLHPLYAALRRAAADGGVPQLLAEALREEYESRLTGRGR